MTNDWFPLTYCGFQHLHFAGCVILFLNPPEIQFPETPVTFTLPLQDTTTSEEGSFTLECHTSQPAKEVQWAKDEQLLTPSEKVEILTEGTVHTLTVKDVTPEDEGLYTAKVGDQVTSARLNVEGIHLLLIHRLQH